jgi:hypothetical protein
MKRKNGPPVVKARNRAAIKERAAIIEARRKGAKLLAVAHACGRSVNTVRKIVSAAGVPSNIVSLVRVPKPSRYDGAAGILSLPM